MASRAVEEAMERARQWRLTPEYKEAMKKITPEEAPDGEAPPVTVAPAPGVAETVPSVVGQPQLVTTPTLEEQRKDMISVSPIYAEQHPEAVTKIGEYYYRPSIPTDIHQKLIAQGISGEAQSEARLKLADYISKVEYKEPVVNALSYLAKHPEDTKTLIAGGVPSEEVRRLTTPSIKVEDYAGKAIMFTPVQAQQLFVAKGEEQFNLMIGLGLLPKGSQFVAGEKPDKWGYLTPEQVKAGEEIKGEIKGWEAKHIKLADDKWMAIDDFNELYKYDQEHNTNYQSIGIRQGYDAMLKAMVDNREAAFKALEPYKVPNTENDYYLDKAIRDKVPDKTLLILFDRKTIAEVKREPKPVPFSVTAIAPTQSVFKVTESGKELASKYPEFTQAIITTMRTADPMDLSEHYGKWVDAWYSAKDKLGEDKIPTLNQYMASLNNQMRDYRSYIMSLPKDSPERKLFNEELRRRGITAAAFVTTVAAPYIFGAVGAVGTQIVSKVVPATIRAMPILGKIPQLVVGIVQYLGAATPIVYTGATIAEAVQTADLEHKWQAFEALPVPKQDAWAKRSGYDNFQTLTDPEKANVLLHYAVPPGYSVLQWSGILGEHTERLIELSQKGSTWLGENTPQQLQMPVALLRIAGGVIVGTVVEATSYMAQLPLISAALIDKVPSGTAKEFATETATGMAAFFTVAIPAAFKADPYFAVGRMVGLFVLTPQAILKLSKSGFAGLKPSYIPERGIAMEFTTVRVEFASKQAGLLAELSPAKLKALGTEIGATLLAGKDYVKGFGTLKLIVETVPYQKIVGNALWHFTPDITTFKGQVPIKGKLYTSPQAAVKAGIASLVTGQKATHPGIIEVRVPEGFTIKGAPIEKMFRKGVEIEAPLEGILDPIPGWQGKGISSNAYMGSYPIRRFTLLGVDTPIVKLSLAKLIKIRAMAMGESVADAFIGWRGRMEMWSREVAGNKALGTKLKRIDAEIAALKKTKTPENIAKIEQLQYEKSRLVSPSLSDYLKGETDFALLHELIAGRQRAVKWSLAKPTETTKLTKDIFNSLKEANKQAKSISEAEVKSQYGIDKAELLRRLDTKKLEKAKTPEALQKEIARLANEQAKLANKRLSQEDIRAYVERGDYLNRRYVSYLDRAIRALGAGIRYEKIPEELAQYRPTPAEIYTEYRAIEPRRYEPLRPSIIETREVPYKPPEERIPPERVPPERVPPERIPPERVPPEKPPPYEPPPYKPPPVKPPPVKVLPPAALLVGKERIKDYAHAVAWRQGALKRAGRLVGIYKVWLPPYQQEDLETYFEDKLPAGVKVTKGGKRSAYESIQLYRGTKPPPEAMTADIGAFLATVKAPTPEPGKAGAIEFARDPSEMLRGTSEEALTKLAFGTSVKILLEETYNKEKIPKKFADKALSDKLGKMKTEDIAKEIRASRITTDRKAKVYKMLPDRVRKNTELWGEMLATTELAPTRGVPKAYRVATKLRRKKPKTKVSSRQIEAIPSIMTTRL